ncbi:MAG: glycosyltransferase family 4 protein [Bacteroidales bacterium]|nr:glycosyltransferase family 4 protein [Bacteroidales bacterium]
MNKVTYFEACDFDSFPLGGTLTFAKQLISCFPGAFNLVGFVNYNEPVGQWFLRDINGVKFTYYGICSVEDIRKKKIPKRLYSYWALKLNMNMILGKHISYVFTQTPQFVFVLGKYSWERFCFLFAGLGNSVEISRFKYLRFLGGIYEKKLFKYLKNSAYKVLAASDIYRVELVLSKYRLPVDFITPFPTRFDNNVFKLMNLKKCRAKHNLSEKEKIFISTGRLSYIKGWRLMIDSFRMVTREIPNSLFIFLGEGEDKEIIEKYCREEILGRRIILCGRKTPEEVASYLNASDVFVMGSLEEGWPTSMVEALACGKVIVSTEVSGARDMIEENINGYIALKRNPEELSRLLIKALGLPNPNPASVQKSKKYSIETLREDFINLCLDEIY